MYYNYKKQMIKSVFMICLIFFIAIVATHNIYYKFKDERNIDYNSESLDIIFHEKSGDKVTLTKITPVTDSVGLSSKAYTFTIKNNLTIPVNYKIKLIDDIETINSDNCSTKQISKDIIKISIKEEKDNKIYNFNELLDNTLATEKIKALGEKEYTIRIWTINTSTASDDMHYHGLIQIIEDNNDIAKAG